MKKERERVIERKRGHKFESGVEGMGGFRRKKQRGK